MLHETPRTIDAALGADGAIAALIARASRKTMVERIDLGPKVCVLRRKDGKRWRNPVNGRRGFRTSVLGNTKTDGTIQAESGGESSLYRFLTVYPPVKSMREQADLILVVDELGVIWTVADCFVELACGGVAWIEGKHSRHLLPGRGGKLPSIGSGLGVEVEDRLFRVQQAFRAMDRHYVVIDESWCGHPIVSENVRLRFAHRQDAIEDTARRKLVDLLHDTDRATIGDCARLFADCMVPVDMVHAAVASGIAEIDFEIPFSLDNLVFPPRPAFWLRMPE